SATPAPAGTAAAPAETPAPAGTATSAPADAASPAAEHESGSQSPLVSVQQAAGGIAALLGTGALAVLAARRRAQQRERRPGQRIAVPEETSRTEMALDRTDSPALVDFLDRALRTLAHHHPQNLPAIVGARVQSDRVEILVEDPGTEALEPFTDRPDGWWGARADRAALLDAEQAAKVPAPYPGLATLGTAQDGTLVLADLTRLRILLLDGEQQHVREVARAIAMEAGTALWTGHIEITAIGTGEELQHLLPQCRVMAAPSLRTATTDLGYLMMEAHQAVNEGGAPPLPRLVVCSTVPDGEELYAFADALGKVPAGAPLAVVLPATGGARQLFPDAQVFDADLLAKLQPLEALDAEIVLQRVTDEAYAQLTTDLTTATLPAQDAQDEWAAVPDPDHHGLGPSSLAKDTAPARTRLALLTAPVKEPQAPGAGAANDSEQTERAEQGREAKDLSGPAGPDAQESTTAAAAPTKDPAAGGAERARPRIGLAAEDDTAAPAGPQVQVLGPLRITGIGDAPIQPRLVLLAALLMFKSDRSYGALANHMDPKSPWTPATMDTQISRLRSRLGRDAHGVPYLRPKPKGMEQYQLSDEVSCDYANFSHLARRGLPRGADGLQDLEAALVLVRGWPFGGAGAHSWTMPLVQTMVGQIVDVAHAVANLRIQDGILDIDAARAAVAVGIDVEPAAEVLYRDWMRVEHKAGNPVGVQNAITQVRKMAVDMGWDGMLQDETEQLIARLTARPGAVAAR
ncbi:hypothetical protein ACWEO1_40670, partial [Kitasatospora cineracea]